MTETFLDRLVGIVADIRLPSNYQLKIGTDTLPEVTDEEVQAALEVFLVHLMTPPPVHRLREALQAARKHQPPRYYFQIKCWREDAIERGKWDWGYGGKAYLSPHATDSELVQTAFGLFKGYYEHEARELFQWRERRVFGPHIKTEALHSIAKQVDVRSAMHVEDKSDDHDHKPIQHRDGKPPWCHGCGLTIDFQEPKSTFDRHKDLGESEKPKEKK